MHFVEILGSKSKQRSSKNFIEIDFIFRRPPMLSAERNDSLY